MSGLTMLEVIVVLLIFGILAAIVLAAVGTFEERSERTQIQNDGTVVASAVPTQRTYPPLRARYLEPDEWSVGATASASGLLAAIPRRKRPPDPEASLDPNALRRA
jgi:prepilin-type N-terminal cleavage/methylation domain-containing protein